MKNSMMVQNLKCGGCAKTIITSLSALENITDVEIDVVSSEISFCHREDSDTLAVEMKLKALGYPVLEKENTVVYKAISFVSCAKGKIRNQ